MAEQARNLLSLTVSNIEHQIGFEMLNGRLAVAHPVVDQPKLPPQPGGIWGDEDHGMEDRGGLAKITGLDLSDLQIVLKS